jgi:pyridinium-3,5-bisthiocarboxylic acid mononucleotide nickel chelatase
LRVLYFDCCSGISGDMTLGALLDLGADEAGLRSGLDKLGLSGFEIGIHKKKQNGIIGTDVEVVEKAVQKERNLLEIETLIDLSGLKQSAKDFSKKVFMEIAKAEAIVHDKDIYDVHFHEAGAAGAIIDIVGTAICLDLLEVKRVFSSVLHDGKGFINCSHGIIPIPVPAVSQMLSGSKIPLVQEDVNTELVTPTGMGIIKCLAECYGEMPAMMIERIGYGLGKRDTGRLNALKVVMGTFFDESGMMEEIAMLETDYSSLTTGVRSSLSRNNSY